LILKRSSWIKRGSVEGGSFGLIADRRVVAVYKFGKQ
jgi:hypothetical protein